jgi:hypothetical protein
MRIQHRAISTRDGSLLVNPRTRFAGNHKLIATVIWEMSIERSRPETSLLLPQVVRSVGVFRLLNDSLEVMKVSNRIQMKAYIALLTRSNSLRQSIHEMASPERLPPRAHAKHSRNT